MGRAPISARSLRWSGPPLKEEGHSLSEAKTAFMFPGQGAQSVGMAREVAHSIPKVRELYEKAERILGFDLLSLTLNGPKEKLDSTVVSQPALFVASLAAVEKLKQENPAEVDRCQAAVGLSLGEYTALVFADAMSFEDGLRVVQIRGQAMQQAADATPSCMISILGVEPEKLSALCEQASSIGKVSIANYLCPGNLVISGQTAACEEVERRSKDEGAMMTVRLAVAGAFHTSIMRPADQRLRDVLSTVPIKPPRIPVLSNVDAQPHSDPDDIKRVLVRQVLEPVLWERLIRRLLDDGFTRFVELGPGRVLAGLMKRIQRKAECVNVTV